MDSAPLRASIRRSGCYHPALESSPDRRETRMAPWRFRVALAAAGLLLIAGAVAPGPACADDDVLLQGFYWDCPEGWYQRLEAEVPDLARAGFTAVWLPPSSKGAAGRSSMGYDVFDHYDLGTYDQKGTVPTRFGTLAELRSLLGAFHARGVRVYADIVLNHMTGGELEQNPRTGTQTWTRFRYPHGRFPKTWMDFHPTHEHPDTHAPYHNNLFGEDLCHAHDYVRHGLKVWGDWLTRTIGFDGYRLDFVKGVEPWYVREWLGHGAMRGRFSVGEYWDSDTDALDRWVRATGASVFDFPLFYTLKSLCNDGSGGFDLRALDGAGYAAKNPFKAVTFVENHDTDRHDPIMRDKALAYAYVLTLEGYPCVFYKDYRTYGLKPQIDRLMSIRRTLAAGPTTTLHASEDLFIAQRLGSGPAPGCALVINDHPDRWKGAWVRTTWRGEKLVDHAGGARSKTTTPEGWAELWAPPRGYAIYGPDVPLR
jgi:alpha-amylase